MHSAGRMGMGRLGGRPPVKWVASATWARRQSPLELPSTPANGLFPQWQTE